MSTDDSRVVRHTRGTALLLLIGGLIGTLASGVLTYDRVRTLEDPLFTPGCNVNAVLSCGDVMTTWQGNLLGFPNMLLGIAGFAALAALGAALVAGAVFPRRLWQGLWAATAAGFAFTVWLIGQCLYVIGALCPWCAVVWAVMMPAPARGRHTAKAPASTDGAGAFTLRSPRAR
ncbi:vitamin K epoxide reductase family protein [Streptomyces sp. NPDC048255]|uniref:vitamin K epoxide reductase family protein n=1 Tax=Streptomyces sp. NPDC048255 TaxID=3154713 RepID=UPI0033C0D704